MQDLSSITRDQTYAPCSGNMEPWTLDCQGSPDEDAFKDWQEASYVFSCRDSGSVYSLAQCLWLTQETILSIL